MLANLPRLTRHMDELGLDAVVATTHENVYYLTGIPSVALEVFPHSGQFYALVTRDRPDRVRLVTSRCDADQVQDAAVAVDSAVGYGTFYREKGADAVLTEAEEALWHIAVDGPAPATALDGLVHTLRAAGLAGARIAVDEEGVPHGFLRALREAAPTADIRLGSEVLRRTRKVKTAEEIRRLTAVAELTECGIRAATAIARPGVTARDLVREFETTVAAGGARPKFAMVAFGRAGAAGQAVSTEPLRRGDSVWLDVGCVLDGYWSDIARLYSLGEPTPKLARYHAAMVAGEERALAEACPGMTGKELFDLAVEAVREAGVPHYRRHHVGHGIGVEIYDPVLVTPDNDDRLEENTVVNFETPYYEFGLGAVQIEDPFVVGADGNRLLTTLERRLTVIG
ncbi:Xaa-Pro peptidase family protein [Streptomyces sp. ADMS]|uniref:Xaa-Pro peptidase family protein n=1 Tax=Streptomyces sp. ADMS TaxID=3071415 RepID=UPI00296F7B2D|nr:Xaa-Pro peptidase family protein [Streptomyces sp. ADMS]MDW4905887.1 Xaa-Pro peptidase family protein [Streptomyces sp. ADMS]